MLRRYCWRVGCAVEMDRGEKCPECGGTIHEPLQDQSWCGAFMPDADERGGRMCKLPVGHDGPHSPAPDPEVVRDGHPRWHEFLDKLAGPEGCNFHEEDDGKIYWDCDGDRFPETTHCRSKRILAAMGFGDAAIEKSLAYFRANGGHCDCEVVFNLDTRPSDEDEEEP